MVDIVLQNNHDAIFMMAMIFIHDFLHDFGNLSGRIKSIKSEIEEFTKYMSEKTQRGGNPRDFFDDEEDNESDVLSILEKWTEFLIPSEISEFFPQVPASDIQSLQTTYNALLKGRATRLRARAIQIIQDFVQETKLYVYGFVYSEESQTGGRYGDTLTMKQSNPLRTKIRFEPNQKVLLKPAQKKFTAHCQYMRTAIDKAIYKSSHNKELVHYFNFMKTLYLHYEDENKNPYSIFNNTHIENALILYLLDAKIVNSNIHFILESLQLQYSLHYKKDKIKGGDPQAIQSYIETEFADIFFVILGAGTVESIYSDYTEPTKNAELKSKIDALVTTVNRDSETLGIISPKIFKSYIEIVNSKYEIYNVMSPDNRKKVTTKKEFVSACINLLKHIYNTVFQHIESINAKLSAEASKSASKSLSAEQKEGPQMILVTVAKGGNQFILANLDKTSSDFDTNTVFKKEIEIIDNIITTKKFTSDTIDEKIKDAFTSYAKSLNPDKLLTSQKAITDLVTQKRREKKNVVAINNAATDALEQIGLDKDSHICPTSSVCDAQGSFGSCPPNKTISNREFYPMDFKIKNADESVYYHGSTSLTTKGKNTKTKIKFGAEVNDFFLPEVQIDIDITEKNSINILGANENYKELLNTIVSIWDKIFKGHNPSTITTKKLWDALLKDTVFIEFVSAGAVKSVGDIFQEINSIAEFGGYNATGLAAKFSKEFRVGANGDRPSGVRAGYLLLKGISGINNNSLAGYFSTGGYVAIRSDIPTVFLSSPAPKKARTEKKAGGSRKLINKINRKTRKYMKFPL